MSTTLSDPNLPMQNLRYKYKAFVFKGYACEGCGWCEEVGMLAIHHKNGKRSKDGNAVKNLMVLCPMCHAKEHYKAPGHRQLQRIRSTKKIREMYVHNSFFRKLFIEKTGHRIAGLSNK
jgi:hypothetical protein